ncbi:MAG: hypothetical protein ACLRWP_15460 [Bilophila wadsworthia]
MKKCFVMVLLCCLLVAGTAFAKTGTLLVAFRLRWTVQGPQSTTSKRPTESRRNEPVLLASPRTSSGTSWPRGKPVSPSTPR